uniref:Uncharacterized protein n=1 Tax=Anopheles culicifacies TaxID=139723 RepID=A0A182LVV1_9DIPT
MYEEFHKDPNGTIAVAFRNGYEVVYDLDNTMEIFHWNRFSNQTITIDPHNIVVPDEVRDLHGFELELYTSKYHNKEMTFDAYLLEQLSKRINATSAVAEVFTSHYALFPIKAHKVDESIQTIFFYPKWMYEEFHKDPNGTIAVAFRNGYEVVYDLDNTMEIFHWNRFSNQTITIDPHNIVVPNEARNLYGSE